MNNFDDLLFSAAETDNTDTIKQLLSVLKELDNLHSEDVKAGLDFLFESWDDSLSSSDEKAEFCYNIALLSPSDSPIFRLALQRAFSKLNRSQFSRSAILKATGLKNVDTSLQKIAERFHVINRIKEGIRVFNSETKRFATVVKLDTLTAEIVLEWDNTLSSSQHSALSLEAALKDLIFFNENEIFKKLASESIKLSSDKWRKTLSDIFISFPDDSVFEQIALTIISSLGNATMNEFKNWWLNKSETEKDKSIKTRHPAEARSVHELYFLLEKYSGADFNDDECAKTEQFFLNLKPDISSSDAVSLIESILLLTEKISSENMSHIIDTIKHKMSFWPADANSNHEKLLPWSKIPAKSISPFAKLTIMAFSADYMTELTLCLPIRCWNGILTEIPPEIICDKIKEQNKLSSDVLIWIWRNRKKASASIVDKLNPATVMSTLNLQIDDSASQASKLKELVIENKDFHMLMLDNVKDHEIDFFRAVQTCDALRMDEKQSLIVKASALSPQLKDVIENGGGKKMFSAEGRKHIRKQKEMEMSLTSVASFNRLNNELNDIITKQIPENSTAIAHARSYGDLRENAEYKAAKERQAFLQRRRAELEENILTVQATDFENVSPGNVAVPGSAVTLKYQDNSSDEVFYLLGIWDSDPDRNFLSCATRLGKIMNGKSVGEFFDMPDGRKASVSKVAKLPSDILELLSE